MTREEQTAVIKELSMQYHFEQKPIPAEMTRDEQFVRCICLGPWKAKRRDGIRQEALEMLSAYDFDLSHTDFDGVFPLEWQLQFLNNLSDYLLDHEATFTQYCRSLSRRYSDAETITHQDQILLEGYFRIVQGNSSSKGTPKVLWLFLRDFLSIPAFPIDRHIKQFLKKHHLPNDPWEMRRLCIAVGVDASSFNRGIIFKEGSGEIPGA